MQVLVESVVLEGTIGIGEGTDEVTGRQVRFVGDWRPMAEIGEALADGEFVTADVPSWAVKA